MTTFNISEMIEEKINQTLNKIILQVELTPDKKVDVWHIKRARFHKRTEPECICQYTGISEETKSKCPLHGKEGQRKEGEPEQYLTEILTTGNRAILNPEWADWAEKQLTEKSDELEAFKIGKKLTFPEERIRAEGDRTEALRKEVELLKKALEPVQYPATAIDYAQDGEGAIYDVKVSNGYRMIKDPDYKEKNE